jgi:hypothetical protein
MSYFEYPLDTLPDLRLISRDDFPETEFGGHATQLTEEHEKLLQSAYLWVQVCKGQNIPASTKGSYSELWFILSIANRFTDLARKKKPWGNEQVVAERIDEYMRAIRGKERGYISSEAIAYHNYSTLESIIGECAKVEVDLEYVRKRDNHESSFHVRDIYLNYPLDSLQDLYPQCTRLTEDHKKLLRSGYLWMQTCVGLDVPPTVKGSYSELWYFLDYLCVLADMHEKEEGSIHITKEHDAIYRIAIRGREHDYLDFLDIKPYSVQNYLWAQFEDLKEIIKSCANEEARIASHNNSSKRTHNGDFSRDSHGGSVFDPRKSRRT